MQFNLNKEQSKGLANFFLDLGKGFFLGTTGIAIIIDEKITLIIFSVLFTMLCVFAGLYLLAKLE